MALECYKIWSLKQIIPTKKWMTGWEQGSWKKWRGKQYAFYKPSTCNMSPESFRHLISLEFSVVSFKIECQSYKNVPVYVFKSKTWILMNLAWVYSEFSNNFVRIIFKKNDLKNVFSPCSIDQMSEAIRYAIEKRQKLKEELVLQQEDFLINTVSKSKLNQI